MNFLNIGTGEFLAILILAILVIGPKRMFTFARTIGRIARKLSSISGEFIRTIQTEMTDVEQETRQAIEGVTGEGADISAEVEGAELETTEAMEGVKASTDEVVSLQTELKALQHEAQEAVREMREGLTGIVTGKQDEPAAEEEQDGEA